jgi:hypothetical protein
VRFVPSWTFLVLIAGAAVVVWVVLLVVVLLVWSRRDARVYWDE